MVTAFGDSKSGSSQSWQDTLALRLDGEVCGGSKLEPIALGGATAEYWADNIDASLASYVGTPTHILVNLGANDVQFSATEAAFKADLAYVLDAFNTKWPSVQVGVAHVWRRDYGAQCATLNGWIDAVLADGRTAWTFAGPDETVWLEGGDDGATMTTDGVHYSTAGQTENAAQWKAAMGY